MSDPVPAMPEAAASGEIAEIFADIRGVLGVAVVNLIWRHLATIPRALPWAWGTLRPLCVDGTITADTAALHGDLDLPWLPPFPPEVLAAAGLLDRDISAIRNVLAAYARTNAIARRSTARTAICNPSPGVAQHASKRLRGIAARARN
jgi:hypothetical protein